MELVDVSGELVYRYDTGHNGPVRLMAATNNYEGKLHTEIKFLTLSTDKLLRVHSLDMSISKKNYTVETSYWGQQTSKAILTLSLESICPLFTDSQLDLKTMKPMDNNPLYADEGTKATALLFYVRSGVKYWLVGDSQGGISLHHFNGTFLRRGETLRAPVVSLDRFGQHVVFASGRTVGTFQLPQMSVQLLCEEVTTRQHSAQVTDVLIDISTSTSIVFASYENGDLLAHDTRYAVNGENVCRTIARMREKEAQSPLKLGGFKGGVAAWGANGVLAFYHSMLQPSEARNSYVSFQSDGTPALFKSIRMNTGGYLMAFAPKAQKVHVYESLPQFHAGTAPLDFGNSRMLLYTPHSIGGIVAVAVGYQICKRSGPRPKSKRWQ